MLTGSRSEAAKKIRNQPHNLLAKQPLREASQLGEHSIKSAVRNHGCNLSQRHDECHVLGTIFVLAQAIHNSE